MSSGVFTVPALAGYLLITVFESVCSYAGAIAGYLCVYAVYHILYIHTRVSLTDYLRCALRALGLGRALRSGTKYS